MNFKKILATVAASALAVSAMSLTAFAATEKKTVTHEGSVTIEGNGGWWAEVEVPLTDLIGDVDPETVTSASVTFTCDDNERNFYVGYSASTDGNGWAEAEAGESLTLTDIVFAPTQVEVTDDEGEVKLENKDYSLKVCLSAGVGQSYEVSWEAEVEVEVEVPDDTDDTEVQNVDVQMVVQDSVTWANVMTDKAHFSKDGVYTFKIDNLEIAPEKLNVIYIKDAVALEKGDDLDKDYKSDVTEDFTVSFALKINDKEVAIADTAPTAMGDKTVLDFCLYNIWSADATHIELPDETINSIELVVTVGEGGDEIASVTGRPADPEETDPEDTDPEETDPEETDPEETDPEETDPEETDPAESNPAESNPEESTAASGASTDKTDGNQPTGLAIAIVPAVVAAAGVIISKKRK